MIFLKDVSKEFPGPVRVVNQISLEIQEGETLVLLGKSGCGKTTILKMINRLIDPSSGQIFIKDRNVLEQDPISLRREIGYAIQHIGLFPHFTIAENIAVVPKLLKWSKNKIEERIDELLNLVGLDPKQYRERFPKQLSGGQRQRIGVARALAADPPIILMDEPFGALDPITREQLQNEFLDLESELKKTIVFVTHDIFEAAKMGDRIALLDKGSIQQLSTPSELVEKPVNDFVHQFLGQHRFQLSLLTRHVKNTNAMQSGDPPTSRPDYYLRTNSTFFDALDIFKQSKKDMLPVFDKQSFKGIVNKADLLAEIGRLFEVGGAV